ncbi:MAG: electron transfer flavoprotein subunit alpha/FixB family protein [Armatimonadota bacterium]|nr:electron transfer flavoprotein subunit alpha/FixB family protein [Armatimonadota bacterium]MDR7450488.1 electron transfer flavoprotein subunit alpha/FixB family protein [Armatimonadota bacterium]MDR7466378.1 electron transfer flavoprotein subunit alpha/FixB family protein [Armatimonadota bacterium]MDR7493100.1 electron transfer flavoprotein subunit alpha/FixB family protein [Armatimonadota bacterium]MDR7498143.1 electron transfer flavoprotein subunit alpha/FixB family protein [Armatimonadota
MSAPSPEVWVYVEHLKGSVAPHTYELLGRGRELAQSLGGRLVAVLLGRQAADLARTLGAADLVRLVDHEQLEAFTPDGHARTMAALAEQHRPHLVLCGATSAGIDLASLLAALLQVPMVANVRAVGVEDGRILATSQLCGGKLLCDVEVPSGSVLAVLAGAYPAEAGMSTGEPPVETAAAPDLLARVRAQVVRLIEPAAGDVDITRVPVLVAVGRGIQRKENLPLAEELAALLGGAVCASRPVIDQGWLPLSRQVGKSGMTVKPRLYLALGISGAPEHLEGMRQSELIVAVNTDPAAPIFTVAHYGVVADIFEILPALVAQLAKAKRAA